MAYGRRFEEWDQISLLASILDRGLLGGKRDAASFHPLKVRTREKPTLDRLTDPRDIQAIMGGILQTVE